MLSVFQLGRFVSPFKIAGTRVIGGFRILRQSAQCTRRPNLKAARFILEPEQGRVATEIDSATLIYHQVPGQNAQRRAEHFQRQGTGHLSP